jgi:hypothetical protein
MRARLARIAKLVEEKGLERVGEPNVMHGEGRLWEIRLERPQRNLARAVRDRRGPTRGDPPDLREENQFDDASQ